MPPLCHHPELPFCAAHDRLPQNQPEPAEIASTLTSNLDDFTSAAQINDFLARLLLLLAYITNQLLRTLHSDHLGHARPPRPSPLRRFRHKPSAARRGHTQPRAPDQDKEQLTCVP